MNDLITSDVHPSWNEFIFSKEIQLLLHDILNEIGDNYLPNKEDVLRFLNLDLNSIRCIVVGMDPYNNKEDGKPVATGRSFEVSNYDDWTKPTKNKSLVNILRSIYYMKTGIKENVSVIREYIKNGEFDILPPNELFDDLEEQGVLFLNASFTVLENNPGSHMSIWKPFTDELIKYINRTNPNVKWLLFGKDANDMVLKYVNQDNVISAPHPVKEQFVDANVFKKVSEIQWCGRKQNLLLQK
jgi:uracil-DNA glycosylase